MSQETTDLTCNDCDYTTGEVREGMNHVIATSHALSGPGKIEGTTLTISFGPADDDYEEDDDWDWAEQ